MKLTSLFGEVLPDAGGGREWKMLRDAAIRNKTTARQGLAQTGRLAKVPLEHVKCLLQRCVTASGPPRSNGLRASRWGLRPERGVD
jgi:hypothetical protein